MVISFTEASSNCSTSTRIYRNNKAVCFLHSYDNSPFRHFFVRSTHPSSRVHLANISTTVANSDPLLRSFVFIFVILSLCQMTIATRIPSSDSVSYSQMDVQSIGEKIIEKERLMPPSFDAIEFPVVIPQNQYVKTLRYVIAKPVFWLTITPCTNRLDRIQFTTTRAARRTLKTSNRYALVLNSTRSGRRIQNQSIVVDRFPGSQHPPNVNVSDDEREILNLQRSRMHYSPRRYSGSALEVKLYGSPGDTFMVRMSIRESPTHTFTGYPKLSNPLVHSVCLVDGTSDTLKIDWIAASSDDMKPQYCVSINDQENLYYRCTAYSRLNPSLLRRYGTLDRPAPFGRTDHLRPETINNFVYTCLPNTNLQVRLPHRLAAILPRLGRDPSAKLFINVYAVNTKVSLSTAYAVRVLDEPVDYCNRIRRVNVMAVHALPSSHEIQWETGVEFDLPAGIAQFDAFYQRCKLTGSSPSNGVSVELYNIREANNGLQRRELCRRTLEDGRINELCGHNHTDGYYLLRIREQSQYNDNQVSGRFYLRRPHTSQDILRVPNTTFNLRITRVLTNSTSEPYRESPKFKVLEPRYTISAATYRSANKSSPRAYHTLAPYMNSRRHRRRQRLHRLARRPSYIPVSNQPMKTYTNGLGIGIDCQGPQVYVLLRIPTKAQYYWIYTTPIPFWMMQKGRDWLFETLNNVTDYCTYPSAYFSKITNNTWRQMKCLSTKGQTELRFLIPAYDHVNDPPYHLISIYVTHKEDVHGDQKELLTQELVDACGLHTSSCYGNKTDNACTLRPYRMSNDQKYTYRLIRETPDQLMPRCWVA